MTQVSLIPYEDIVQDALKSVVARVLDQVAREGLPGDHHFFIAFKTHYPGVQVPKSLIDRYPEEITIVIQHRFWDLKVLEDRFEVGLSFNQRPTIIRVPFGAITGFMDPSVNFALQFQVQDADSPFTQLSAATNEEGDVGDAPTPDDKPEPEGGNVVTMDRFRKKP